MYVCIRTYFLEFLSIYLLQLMAPARADCECFVYLIFSPMQTPGPDFLFNIPRYLFGFLLRNAYND